MKQRPRGASCSPFWIVLALASFGSARADILTVDDDGPADFAVVADAVAAAQPGDVIVVELGNYTGDLLAIDKPITIAGRNGGPRPAFGFGIEMQADVPFAMARIRASSFTATDITSRLRLQGCSFSSLTFNGAGQAMVNGGEVKFGIDAVKIYNGAVVSMAGVEIVGGSFDDLGTYGVLVSNGLSGLVPNVTLAGCDVEGGSAGGGFIDGNGGDAIFAVTGPTGTSVRGSSFHTIRGGTGLGGFDGTSIVGNVDYSGVATVPAPPILSPVDPPQPYLTNTSSRLGEVAEVDVFGPAGQPALLLGSLGTVEPVAVPGWDGGRLWVNPAALVLIAGITLDGQDDAATSSFTIPDDETLIGLTVDLQAIAVMPGGAWHLTNPGQFIVRP